MWKLFQKLVNELFEKNWLSAILLRDGQSIFELESENENVDGQTDRRQTQQSNRRVGCTQPA